MALDQGYYKEDGMDDVSIRSLQRDTATLIAVEREFPASAIREDVTIARYQHPLPVKVVVLDPAQYPCGFVTHGIRISILRRI